jgi:ornithine cyclodeaminase/alanine dehydrogenase-like protein (mu-crystallin family)
VIRYLSEAQVEECRPGVLEGIALARNALTALASDRAQLPPKSSVFPRPGCFANTMPAYVAQHADGEEALGLKWVGVYPTNPERGLALINGVIMVADAGTGVPRAIMGASYETGIRTAAVSGACLQVLARPVVGHVAITGAGVQTRTHLEVCEALGHLDVSVYARRESAGAELLGWAASATPEVRLTIVGSAEEAIRSAGVIITGVPIGAAGALVDPGLVDDDALVLPLDYGTSIGSAIANDAHLYADDVPQFARFIERGAFPGYRNPDGYSGEAITLAERPGGRIVCQNLGQGAADMLFARAILANAEARDVGTLVPR